MTPYLIVTGDFVRTGGMDMANFALASYLADHGSDVHLVSHRVESDLSQRNNIFFHRVPKPLGANLLGAPLLSRQGQVWGKRISPNGGRVIVNGGNCVWGDVNWVHYVHAAYKPDVFEPISSRLREALFHRSALSAERNALAKARVVICNSQQTRRDVIERLGVEQSRTHVVYYGTEPQRFKAVSETERVTARKALGWSGDRPVVVFVGALADRRKGFDTLFSAWHALCKNRSWDCDLAIVGTGAELPRWQRRTREVGLTERIKFLGFRDDVPRVLAAGDVLVHPARYEAYGLSVHEALCRGLPAIVSASAGVAERYPDELNQLLIQDPDNTVELMRSLQNWRSSVDAIKDRVARLSALLRFRTWDAMADEILRIIESAV